MPRVSESHLDAKPCGPEGVYFNVGLQEIYLELHVCKLIALQLSVVVGN